MVCVWSHSQYLAELEPEPTPQDSTVQSHSAEILRQSFGIECNPPLWVSDTFLWGFPRGIIWKGVWNLYVQVG